MPGQGVLYSWGYNSAGQLGLGDSGNYTPRSSPNQVGSLTTWVVIANGSGYGMAIKTDGTLWAWGDNSQGQLGFNNQTSYSSPKQVGALTSWSIVSAPPVGRSTLAIKTDGTLWSWGDNYRGQLGLGSNSNYYSSPKQVGSLTTWSRIYANDSSTVAIKTDGTLWTWGYNIYGQLGLGNRTSYSSPKQVGSLTTWAAGSSSLGNLAIKTDGTLWAWGYNGQGQLGTNNSTRYSSPVQVGSLTQWLSISSSYYGATFSIKTNGTAWAWGNNSSGQLGLGNTTYYSSPKQIGLLTNWSKITSGSGTFSLGLKTDGTLWSWGSNGNGQLGLGNTTNYSSPKQIGAATNWTNISNGNNFAFANRI